jgi:hypothetical protein
VDCFIINFVFYFFFWKKKSCWGKNNSERFFLNFILGRPKAEGGRKRKAKDPNRPKRSTSAYFFFLSKMREDSKKAGKAITKV